MAKLPEAFFTQIFILSADEIKASAGAALVTLQQPPSNLRKCFMFFLAEWLNNEKNEKDEKEAKEESKAALAYMSHFYYPDKSKTKVVNRMIFLLGKYQEFVSHQNLILTGEILTLTRALLLKCKAKYKKYCQLENFYYHWVVCLMIALTFWNEAAMHEQIPLSVSWSRYFVMPESAIAKYAGIHEAKEISFESARMIRYQKLFLENLEEQAQYQAIEFELDWGPKHQNIWHLAVELENYISRRHPPLETSKIQLKLLSSKVDVGIDKQQQQNKSSGTNKK